MKNRDTSCGSAEPAAEMLNHDKSCQHPTEYSHIVEYPFRCDTVYGAACNSRWGGDPVLLWGSCEFRRKASNITSVHSGAL